jgi:putative pyruvate formate lyase activating enzyme
MDGRYDRPRLPEELGDGSPEVSRGQLHLPELVDDHDLACRGTRQRRKRKPVEGLEIDSVLAYTRRAGKIDVGEERPIAAERLDREADPTAAFAELFSREASEGNARRAKKVGQPARDRRLPAARSAFEQDPHRRGRCYRRLQRMLERPYVALARSGELERRATEAHDLLGERCIVCPRGCKVDRRRDQRGLCSVGRHAVVASYFPHFGEENCLRGWRGSGTIFFSGCNLRCVFCQNHDISWELRGELVTPERLAGMMLELQAIGCHNVNWVTPEHVVPQILEAVPLAVEGGLRLPIVYNTSAYDSPDSLRLMHGIVDVYMPDFKLWTSERARSYLKRADYGEVARPAIKEMHRQVGDLVLDEEGLARSGLILRHLVMPGLLDETEAILRWVAEELGTSAYVNLMAQYYVSGKVGKDGKYEEIARGLYREEYEQALALAQELGLRLDARSVAERGELARAG